MTTYIESKLNPDGRTYDHSEVIEAYEISGFVELRIAGVWSRIGDVEPEWDEWLMHRASVPDSHREIQSERWMAVPTEATPEQISRLSQFDMIHSKRPHQAKYIRELYAAFLQSAPSPAEPLDRETIRNATLDELKDFLDHAIDGMAQGLINRDDREKGYLWAVGDIKDALKSTIYDMKSQPAQPTLNDSIAQGIAETISNGDGFWRSCTGCHELNEGHATGTYSDIFKCHLGSGCRECGGIGAIWDDTDYDAMGDAMAKSMDEQPAQPSDTEKATHTESDGCPTEKAVLQRFWREHQKDQPSDSAAEVSDTEMLDFMIQGYHRVSGFLNGWRCCKLKEDGSGYEWDGTNYPSPREAIKAAMQAQEQP